MKKKITIFIIALFIVLAVGFYLFCFFEVTSKHKKVSKGDAQKHIDNYLDQIQTLVQDKYPEDFKISKRYEDNIADNDFSKSDSYDGYLISISYFDGKETFSIHCDFEINDLDEISKTVKQKINLKAIEEILKTISGHVFTEDGMNAFIDDAISSKKTDENCIIHAKEIIGFFEDWVMSFQVTDGWSKEEESSEETHNYNVSFSVCGYTKEGTR